MGGETTCSRVSVYPAFRIGIAFRAALSSPSTTWGFYSVEKQLLYLSPQGVCILFQAIGQTSRFLHTNPIFHLSTLIHPIYKMAQSILLLNGPNLNLLGTREPATYGSTTLSDVTTTLSTLCAQKSISFAHLQSNHEGVLIDRIHEARGNVDAVVINPGALTHTSVALRDALLAVDIPFVEVHISNVHKREPFRHHSYLSDKAEAVICGLGVYGYEAAVEFASRSIAPRARS
jgi:3-dehydroquinate dehydratase-2